MYEFKYHKPASVSEAADLLSGDENSQVVAGGMTLLPTMKMRLANPSALIDLGGIEELAGIRDEGDSVVIGAMTCHADVADSATVQQKIPALSDLASQIGDAQVRNRGTLGGSVSNNDPAADYPAAVLGLGATIVTNSREIASDDFFMGMFETALEPGETVLEGPGPRLEEVHEKVHRTAVPPDGQLCSGHDLERFGLIGL